MMHPTHVVRFRVRKSAQERSVPVMVLVDVIES